ncbi:uncharacterized protein DFL_007028 [Arthrobotrys flagrans]|uniref:Uncharacterized protein n=1 Tax=Arthrobotrys flagrans TaxID=97331 RepID=A0A436ZV50_ARTFL|nr:hypothetical protein DFL_007028 [Arthrobotrys flagrans]
MAPDLAFLLPITFVIIIIVLLFIYLCTRNSRPQGLCSFNGISVWEDIKYFFTGPTQRVEVAEIRDEESGTVRTARTGRSGKKSKVGSDAG